MKKTIARKPKKVAKTKTTVEGTPYVLGEKYFIRTVTMIYTGRLHSVYKDELVLTECAWIADTGRYANALVSGEFNEVEPYPSGSKVNINRGSILDSLIVMFELPKTQK